MFNPQLTVYKKGDCLTSMLGSLFCKSSSIDHCCAKMIGKNSRLICEKGRLMCRKVYVKACAKKKSFCRKKQKDLGYSKDF